MSILPIVLIIIAILLFIFVLGLWLRSKKSATKPPENIAGQTRPIDIELESVRSLRGDNTR